MILRHWTWNIGTIVSTMPTTSDVTELASQIETHLRIGNGLDPCTLAKAEGQKTKLAQFTIVF